MKGKKLVDSNIDNNNIDIRKEYLCYKEGIDYYEYAKGEKF